MAWFQKGEPGLTRTGIRIQHRNALLTGLMLEKTLFSPIVARAGQARQIHQQRDFMQRVQGRLGREVEVEAHLAGRGFGIVR